MAKALSFSELEGAWIAAGGEKEVAPLMAAIALAESSGVPTATNPTDNNGRQTSWGLWQISNGDHSEPSPNWADPVTNARLAVAKYHNRSGLRNWGVYVTGAYRKYLQSGVSPTTPAPGAGGPGGAGGAGAAGAGGVGGVQSAADLSAAWGPWLGTLLGTAVDPAIPGILGTTLGPISNVFKDFGSALNIGMSGLLWIVNPRNWVRIIAGVVGGAAALVGVFLLFRAV